MMNILLIAATEAEIAPLIKHISTTWEGGEDSFFKKNAIKLEILISGIGMLATSYSLTKKLTLKKYDLVVQAGVGGTYDKNINLGSVVWVKTDQLADLRVEDQEQYQDFFELGLINSSEPPFTDKELVNPYSDAELRVSNLLGVNAITVNTVTGKQATIEYMDKKYNVEVESMEGAALHYISLQEGVKFLQIRGISNYVEPRNRSNWKIEEAITNMNKYLIKYFG